MKKGDLLVAIDECKMLLSSEPSLIVGKVYEVKESEGNMFLILDKYDSPHWFSFKYKDMFFKDYEAEKVKLLSWWMHNENNVNAYGPTFMSHGIWEVHKVTPKPDDENYYTMRLIMPMHHYSKLYETTELSESTLLQIAHRVEIKHHEPELSVMES